ncbi:hypothetical protein ACFU6R_03300 [Streptomyces sp. NPDC057499]|uniref:hypothetical protein n=1 Tax=Streptomyces sp. NPDC057499 TaxID=3346150 RepID=UPI0036CC2F23
MRATVLERSTFVADGGRIKVFLDYEEEDYRIVADADGYDPRIMKEMLDFLEQLGLELIDEGEYEPEFDEEDNIVSYLCETDTKSVSA